MCLTFFGVNLMNYLSGLGLVVVGLCWIVCLAGYLTLFGDWLAHRLDGKLKRARWVVLLNHQIVRRVR